VGGERGVGLAKEGLGMARSWAEKMTEETGEKCVVKKR